MKNCNKFLALALAALSLAACSDKAHIRGTLAGAPDKKLVVKQLEINVYKDLDTVKTAADGSFRYDVPVAAGQPEFIYIFYGDTRVAALLLEKGETAVVEADTLGYYTVSGSEGSTELAKVEKAYSDFLLALADNSDEPSAMTKLYVQHYRDCVRYVLEHPYSLTTVPVFFERLGQSYVFAQPSDALLVRRGADSLATVYPESRYVKALAKEATGREQVMDLNNRLQDAPEASFPDIVSTDIKGERKALSEVQGKVILVHFWDATDAAQKMLSLDTLLPLYKEYHPRGFEIFSICVTPDKPEWASSVLAQKLPWINVNDGLGATSPAVITYGVTQLPDSFLIINGELNTTPITGGVEGLRKTLAKVLR